MNLIFIFVFLGVFTVAALVMIASGTRDAQESKQVKSALDSALAAVRIEERELLPDLRKNERFSSIPWIDRKLLKFELVPQLQKLLRQADLQWTAGRLLAGCAVCALIPAFLLDLRFASIPISLSAGLLLGFTPFLWVFRKRSRRFHRFEEQLPEAMDLMVSALRAGHSLVAAIGFVAKECGTPVGTEFKACFEEQKYGLDLKTAMDNMIERVPLQDLRIISTAIMIQNECGGNLAEVLDKTSSVIRERFRLLRQVSVHTAQGRLTGWILTLLPVVLGAALYTVNPEMMSILWKTPIGIKLLWTAGGMVLAGGLIIRHIVNVDI
jgi:tight adherence protein B